EGRSFSAVGRHFIINESTVRYIVPQEWDDDMVHLVHFCNIINNAKTPYKTIFPQKKKQRQQLPITMYLSRKKHWLCSM
ncbi:hypothetical protein SK128_007020, partial [Halocaridina rubra]